MRSQVKLFKALSDPNRLRILKMLEERELCVCEITNILGLATSTVSKHLSILRDNELIIDRKIGKWVNYSLNGECHETEIKPILEHVNTILNSHDEIIKDRKKLQRTDRYNICKL